MPQAGNPITKTRAVIRITLPQTQRPVGLVRSSPSGSCASFGVGLGLGSRFGFATALGLDVDTCLGPVFFVGSGCGDGFALGSSFGLGSCAADGFTVGAAKTVGLGGAPNGRKASHERVSALTCIPYLTPACLAVVQLKNLSPVFGLKF